MTDDPRTCSRVHRRFDWSQIGTLILTLVSTFHTMLNLTCDFFSYLISKVQGVAFLTHLILPFSIISRIVYQDNVHQQSSYAKLGDQSEQSEQALVNAPAVEDQSDLLRTRSQTRNTCSLVLLLYQLLQKTTCSLLSFQSCCVHTCVRLLGFLLVLVRLFCSSSFLGWAQSCI